MPTILAFSGEVLLWPRLQLQIFWLMTNLNPACNVIIFLKRQKEIREGVHAFFSCKGKPVDIKLWKVNIAPTAGWLAHLQGAQARNVAPPM